MKRLLVDQANITDIKVEDINPQTLQEGQVRLKIESFALTANNITYAASGFAIGYWSFFPTGVPGKGQVPVWGVAKVVESRSDGLDLGQRLYGFYPLAEELVIAPKADAGGMIVDTAPHRKDLPAVYNRYAPVSKKDDDQDHMRALLQPLLATSYLLADWLRDNKMFDAKQVIVGSASSKTGLGLCKFLAEDENRTNKIVGLTSVSNVEFVNELGACDQVLSYDEISMIEKVPSVYVDMSGNAEVKTALHAHLGDILKHSAAVGISHWDKFQPKLELAGPKPEFFFAPAQIAKRRDEWGPGVIEKEITAAWKRIAANADDWISVHVHKGLEGCLEPYAALASGQADPKDGHIIRP